MKRTRFYLLYRIEGTELSNLAPPEILTSAVDIERGTKEKHVVEAASDTRFQKWVYSFEKGKAGKIKGVDYYGNSPGPTSRGPTAVGGIISIIFALGIIAFNIINIIQLVDGQRSKTSTGSIYLNPHENVEYTVYGLFSDVGVEVHFPVLDLLMDNEIVFFENDKPSIQKIQVIDNMFYNPSFATDFSDPPSTRSVYTRVSVPYNSVQMSGTTGAKPPVIVDLSTLLTAQLAEKFSQDIQTLDLIQLYMSTMNYSFYTHEISLYIRFKQEQMQQLLDDQLDIALFNKGEWKSTNYSTTFSALNTLTIDNTLHKITQAGPFFNVLVLRNSLEHNASDGTDAINWNVGIQYSANFNYTFGDNFCYNKKLETANLSPFGVLAWANVPQEGDHVLQIADSKLSWNIPTTPFSILIMNHEYREKVTVIFTQDNTLYLQSPITKNFNLSATNCMPFRGNVQDFKSYLLPDNYYLISPPFPLPLSMYSTYYRATVDASKWYHEQSCECYENHPNLFCTFCAGAQVATMKKNGSVCDINYTNQTTLQPSYVAVMMVCGEDEEPFLLGENILRGSFGIPAPGSTSPCPEDEYYNHTTNTHFDDKTVWCNEKPTALVSFVDQGARLVQPLTKQVDYAYNATLEIGTSKYLVSVDFYTKGLTNTIYNTQLLGLLPYEECGTSAHSLPATSAKYLFSPLSIGETVLLVYNDNRPIDNFFPEVGPYNVSITVDDGDLDAKMWTLTVLSATCSVNNVQKLILQQPPTPAILNSLKKYFFTTTTYELLLPGNTHLNIWSHPNITTQLCRYLADRTSKSGNITIGNNNADMFMTFVVDVMDSLGYFCCPSLCQNETRYITLQLYDPVPLTILQGTNVNLQDYNIAAVPIGLQIPLTAVATSKENILVYKAQDRSRSLNGAGVDLELEMAAFIVPNKKHFEEFQTLCTTEPRYFDIANSSWRITRTVDVKGCIPNKTMPSKLSENIMSPTFIFSFSQNIPVNNKWAQNNGLINSLNSPEYTIDMSTVYYFDYTEDNLNTARQFSANTPNQGDYDQYANRLEFNGELDFIGRSSSTHPIFKYYPASAPVIYFTLELNANTTATNQLVKAYGKSKGIWRSIGWTLSTVDNFKPITIQWPNILPLTLQPGFNYTFKAIVSLQPEYDVGMFGERYLVEWQNSVDTRFEKVKSSFANQANVRLQIEFAKDVSVLENRVIYTLFDFLASLGSSVGLFSLGMLILSPWQFFSLSASYRKKEREDCENPYHEDPTPCPVSPRTAFEKTTNIINSHINKKKASVSPLADTSAAL